ncbi:MAG: DUF2085 domain-containing protein [Acidobacteriota bacterium]
MFEKKIIRNVFIFTLAGIIIWLSLIFIAPVLKSLERPSNAFIYSIFSPICHQTPSRCFYLYGYPLAVCTRCLGIYFGFLLGTLSFPLINGCKSVNPPKKQIFFVVSAPILMDTFGIFFNLWHTSDWLRFFIGFIWGIILPYYLIVGFYELLMSHKHFS